MSASKCKDQNMEMQRLLAASASLPSDVLPEQVLHALCPDGKMTASACKKIMEFTEKERKVKEVFDLSRVKVRPDDGRIYVIIKRKIVSSHDYVGLVDKLFEQFFGIANSSLTAFYDVWEDWRRTESSVTEKTIKENRILWNALLKDASIAQLPLKELTVQDFISFFRQLTKGRGLTRKRFNDMKSILNGMLYLAVEKGIIEHNCLRDINYKQFAYKPINTEVHPYTEEERLQVIAYLQNQPQDLYTLAILLDFHLVLRIGELKALKWSDIHEPFIQIQRFINDQNQIIEEVKGHTSEGFRSMPLTPAALSILQKIHAVNPDSPFLFHRDGQPLSTTTFNRRLKKCCDALGIQYRSSHKLRFSTASIMYKNGMEDTELQKLLGHTTLSMTRHYLRNVTSEEQTALKMASILG